MLNWENKKNTLLFLDFISFIILSNSQINIKINTPSYDEYIIYNIMMKV